MKRSCIQHIPGQFCRMQAGLLILVLVLSVVLSSCQSVQENPNEKSIPAKNDGENSPHVLAADSSDDVSQILEQLKNSSPRKYRLVVHGSIQSMDSLGKSLRELPDGVAIELDLSKTVGISQIGRSFHNCTSLVAISLPYSVVQISPSAFEGCTSLTQFTVDKKNKYFSTDSTGKMLLSKNGKKLLAYPSATGEVSIPKSIMEIGNFAFASCINLTAITIPGSVTDIGGNAFFMCTALTSVVMLPGVKTIWGGAFNDCTSLVSVSIPESVTEIKSEAFTFCTSLEEISLASSIIGNAAFGVCPSLTSVFISASVTEIAGDAFAYSPVAQFTVDDTSRHFSADPTGKMLLSKDGKKLISYPTATGDVAIPEGVREIGYGAFGSCNALSSIIIPEGVTTIGEYAFTECTSLVSVSIPDSVSVIEDRAFNMCTSLASVSIPSGVTEIGVSSFGGCTMLTKFIVNEKNEHFSTDSTGKMILSKKERALLAYPSAMGDISIPNGVTKIGDAVFSGCTSLTSVTIPEGVVEIGSSAFEDCRSLTSILIPNTVSRIGEMGFRYCSSLVSLSLPNNISVIARNTFDGCSSLESIPIPESVASIGFAAFQGCKRLEAVVIPDSVTLIELAAFNLCSGLALVTFEDTENWFFCSSEGEIFGKKLDVSNPAVNAKNLKDYRAVWSRKHLARKIN